MNHNSIFFKICTILSFIIMLGCSKEIKDPLSNEDSADTSIIVDTIGGSNSIKEGLKIDGRYLKDKEGSMHI